MPTHNPYITAVPTSAPATPQLVPASVNQTVNNANGYVFRPTDTTRLERFLTLGTYDGTYYATEQQFTQENIEFLHHMLKETENTMLDMIADVSTTGKAYRNSPALFALALVFTYGKNKTKARIVFEQTVRTSTHLFEFVQHVDNLGGWGRAKKRAVAQWYTSRDEESLAYQLVKYRRRNGWTHRDVLRLAHPTGVNPNLAHFTLGKPHTSESPAIAGYELLTRTTTADEALSILSTPKYSHLPWETIPTRWLTDARIWKTLFYNGQLNGQALLRNVTRLAKLDAFADPLFTEDYAKKLTDTTMMRHTRLHPINYLLAAIAYTEGNLDRHNSWAWSEPRRHRAWTVNSTVAQALNTGYYGSFTTATPANKRTLVAVDVSSSMRQPAIGIDLSCAQTAAAVAMTVARTEPDSTIVGFTAHTTDDFSRTSTLTDLNIGATTTLSAAMSKVQEVNFGGTDCALPIQHALENNLEVDTFVIITDNETWAGNTHPHQALQQYRHTTGIPARVAVLGVASNGFTVADPDDTGMLDIVGFSTDTPKLLADFSAGKI